MPIYDYHCVSCDADFTELRPMSRHTDPTPCPACGSPAQRLILAPRLNTMRADLRLAHQTNERSAHQPKLSQAHRCGPGCSHNTSGKTPLRRAGAEKRPWMLGH